MGIYTIKKIPYGESDYKKIIERNFYYIDKTPYIEKIEMMPSYLFFIRPRRFGKSLLISMLDYYYDINFQDKFNELFGETYIGKNPTQEANKYHILRFDFSVIDSDNARESFNEYCNIVLNSFVNMYHLDITLDNEKFISNLNKLLSYSKENDIFIYLIIDEYDNFVNKILVANIEEYKTFITDKEAVYKILFTVLKSGSGDKNSPIKRMFITGVSPMALYDVTSGFNIGSNISTNPIFNEMVGVTEDELHEMIKYYNLEDKVDLDVVKKWYNNYLFSDEAIETIYNSDMILYYLNSFIINGYAPKELIDINVRSDYSKLRFLVYTNKKLNGNFNSLQELITNGSLEISQINDNFSALNLTQADNFKSLMFFLGLATIESDGLSLHLSIPNETIKRITADYIKESLRYEDVFKINLDELGIKLRHFALNGDMSVFEYLADEINNATSLRDYITRELVVKAMFLTYLNITNFYVVQSEPELNKGFADLFLEPFHEAVKYVGVIEFKYIKKEDFTDKLLEEKIQEAKEQLQTYIKDKRVTRYSNRVIKPIVIVYSGAKMVYMGF